MGNAQEPTARDISELLLNKTADAMLSGDFEAFSRVFHVPHCIETADKKRVLKTAADLRAVFERVAEDYRQRGVTELIRISEFAEFQSPTLIKAMHTTHVMAGHHRLMDPFPCYSVLEHIDGHWKCTSSQYAVDKKTLVGRALAPLD